MHFALRNGDGASNTGMGIKDATKSLSVSEWPPKIRYVTIAWNEMKKWRFSEKMFMLLTISVA